MPPAVQSILDWFTTWATKVQSRKLVAAGIGIGAAIYLCSEHQLNVQTAAICITGIVVAYLIAQSACDIAEIHAPTHAYDGNTEIPPPAKVAAPDPTRTGYEPIDN
jgi:hypothetical protein